MRALRLTALFLLLLALPACQGEEFTQEELRIIDSLRLSRLPPLPPDPGNAHGDDPAAAALGASLFFDTGLSADGTVACVTCHQADRQFQDDLPLAEGIGTTTRRTMPIAGTAHGPWFFWDGRKDSQWSQALGPLENPVEHGTDRLSVARFVAGSYAEPYEAIFGPLPDLSGLPEEASPLGTRSQQEAWTTLDRQEQEEIDRVFANLGKAIAAFERTIEHGETRFDRFAEALVTGREIDPADRFTALETEGLKLFIGKANCIDCHNGPRFTDDHFHNTGVPAVAGLPSDRGRADAIAELEDDPFNCLGPYSDAEPSQCRELRFMLREGEELVRAYKTPSLRDAASRPPYMHAGQFADLEEVVDHYSTAPDGPEGHSELRGVVFTDRGRAALIAFLRTLE